jgi:hypothetical protein
VSAEQTNLYIPAGSTITVQAHMLGGGDREMILTTGRMMRLRLTPVVEEGQVHEYPGFWFAEPDAVVGFEVEMTGFADRLTIRELD